MELAVDGGEEGKERNTAGSGKEGTEWGGRKGRKGGMKQKGT